MLLQVTVITIDILINTEFIVYVWLLCISVPESLLSLRSKNSCLCFSVFEGEMVRFRDSVIDEVSLGWQELLQQLYFCVVLKGKQKSQIAKHQADFLQRSDKIPIAENV